MLGRLDNVSVVMGFHPHYLESFLRTQHYLLQMDGPLSLHYRHYIGIMVLCVTSTCFFLFFFFNRVSQTAGCAGVDASASSHSAGSSQTPVFLLGQPACERLPPGRGGSKVAERLGRSPAEAAAARGAQQNPGPQTVAPHQGAYGGERLEAELLG